MAVMIVATAGAEPRAVQIEDLRGKLNVLGIETERIVYADKELLRRECNRAASGIVVGEELGLFVEDLRSEYALLEGDDLGQLGICGGCGGLRMTESGVTAWF